MSRTGISRGYSTGERLWSLLAVMAVTLSILPPQALGFSALAQETGGDSSVSGVVWSDDDGDGVRADDEDGLGGVALRLLGSDGQVVDAATSDGGGEYSFVGVAAGTYRIEAQVPGGYEISPPVDPDEHPDVSVNAFEADPATEETTPVVTDEFQVTAGDEANLGLGLAPDADETTTTAPDETTTTTVPEETTTSTTGPEETTTTTHPEETTTTTEPEETTTTTDPGVTEAEDDEAEEGEAGQEAVGIGEGPETIGTLAAVDCVPEAPYTECVAFTYEGADQPLVVPDGVTSIDVKVWGAGGGGSIRTDLDIGAPGGSGGYVGGTLSVSPGDEFVVMTGGGGGGDGTPGTSPELCDAAYGFGGACPPVRPTNYIDGGGGGGLSGLFTGSTPVTEADQARAVLIAGGGGAGEGTTACSNQSAAGGAGGNAFSGAMLTMQGVNGAYNAAAPGSDPTGGGGGYFGGDGTDRLSNGTCARSANGGSNFVAAEVTDSVDLAGNEAASVPQFTPNDPPNTTDTHYVTGVGVGETALGAPGGDGLVVVQFVEPLPEPFPACPTDGFLGVENPSDWHSLDLVTGQLTLINDDLGENDDIRVNAIGYSMVDDRVYGVELTPTTPTTTTGYVVVIGDNGEARRLGPVDGLADVEFLNTGDVSPDGVLHVTTSRSTVTDIMMIDVDPSSPDFLTMTTQATSDGDGDAGGVEVGADWAFAPDGVLYSLRSNSNELVTVDPATGEVDLVRAIAGLPADTGYGAQFFDANGFLYAYAGPTGVIYRIDIEAGEATPFAQGDVVSDGDGARCADAPLPIDFGDAPDVDYGTELATDGPRHAVPDYDPGSNSAPLMLGPSIDIETDGQPSADASGDGGDEDGVASLIVLFTGQPTTVTVSVTNDTGENATLAGWIDLNDDGDFDDAGEQAVVPVTGSGDYDLTFPAPTAVGDGTFARFRLFPGDVSDPQPTGPASAGEVEDYPVEGPIQPTWECTPDGMLFQYASATPPTHIELIDLVTGDSDTAVTIENDAINAVGFNVLDGYIYGWANEPSTNSGELVRVGADGSVFPMGRPTGVPDARTGVGEVDENGHYWTIIAGNWYQIDLAAFTLLDSGPVTGDNIENFAAGADWAFVPGGGDYLYRVMRNPAATASVLFRFDRSSGLHERVGTNLGALGDNLIGAVYADADGFLYASSNNTGQIFRIDVHTPEKSFFAQGPSSNQNDGTRCFNAPILIDLGDAPNSYGTVLNSDGARHGVRGHDETSNTAPLMLGESIDVDTDGQPTTAADGDGDDEDAVADPIVVVPGEETTVTVTVTNDTDQPATLAGWLDLNRGGTFGNGAERVFITIDPNTGTADYELTFPANAATGLTYARFRLFPGTVSDPQPTGPASDGEVEDYRTALAPQPPFVCDATGYLSQGAPTDFYSVDLVTGDDSLLASDVYSRMNAIGYNTADDFIYGWARDENQAVRVGSDLTAEPLGTPGNWASYPFLNDQNFQTGAFAADGTYWMAAGGTDPLVWAQIDLRPGSSTFGDVLQAGQAAKPTSPHFIADWALNLSDNNLYSLVHNPNTGNIRVWRFDPSNPGLSEETNLGAIIPPGSGFGAAYSDADGFLYASHNADGRIIRLDMDTFDWEPFADGPAAGNNDGAMCVNAKIHTDFGDAPDGYGTTLSADGARHAMGDLDPDTNTSSLMLGTTIDAETDGAPSPGSDGDDAADIDDEDAVAGPVSFVAGQPTTVPVTVTNDTGDVATLAAWADLNGNGVFDPDERVIVPVTADPGTRTVDVPFDPAFPACQNVRFRLYPGDVADPSPIGPASGGEVEDHPVVVEPDCTADDIPLTVDGVAQAWTPDSQVQTSSLPESLAVNGPDGAGTQIYSAATPSNVLTLDLATVVPVGNSITLHLAQPNENWSGPARVTSSVDGVTFGDPVDFTPTALHPTYDEFDYIVPDGGARYIRIVPLAVDGVHSAIRVDAATYSFVTCECEDAVNFVEDASFETFGECSVQEGTFGAWTVIENDVHIWGENCPQGWESPDGVNSVDLDGGATGGMEQSISGLTPGNTYNLSFYMAFNPAAGAESSSMRVTIADFDDTYTSASNATLGGFNLVHVEFTAQNTTELLRFESLTGSGDPDLLNGGGTSGFGVVIDDVRITPRNCDEIPLEYDFGDAPDTFGTTIGQTGPQHAVPVYDPDTNTAPVMLGSLIDIEADGQPNDGADGDDTTEAADEDGVAFNPALGYANPVLRTGLDPVSLQPLENTLEVEASAPGFVSVWVDWNQDGDFDDAGEQVANAQVVVAGLNDITFIQGTNPDDISTYVRVRYSTDEASIATPYGPAPDGEVEDYRVLVERLVQPDACTDTGEAYYAFTFDDPVELVGDGTIPTSGRYENVTVVDGVAVDMFVEVVAGTLSNSSFPPNGLLMNGGDNAAWSVRNDATLAYHFYEAGTTNPVAINGVFTVNDVDDVESATFSSADLAAYAVTQGSAVSITESGGNVTFDGNGNWNGDPESRFQIVLEDISTFEARWQGGSNSGFAFDGDADLSIQPPACEDWGDAPDSYGTTAAANGPNHTIVPGLFMGDEIDFDPDGQATPDADGDDTNRLDDEDGVADEIVVTHGEQTTVDVSVTNTTGDGAVLAGWIDLDNSGTFDAGELQTIPVPDGTNGGTVSLTFDAPSAFGDTYARFRLFPDGATISPTGPADAGEVEDYRVTGAVQPQWACPAEGLLFQYPGGTPTEVQFVDLVTGDVKTGELEIEDRSINAAAYNVTDDYVYGWDNVVDPDSPDGDRVGIVRIGPDGSTIELGVPDHPDLPPRWTFPVGDIDSNGHYWVSNSTGAGANARWFQIDLNAGPTFMEVLSTGLVGDGDAAGYGGSGDWGWVPNDDAIYRVMREGGTTQWSLFRFDRASGEHQRLGALPQMNGYSGTFGAAYADPDFLYVAHNASGDIFRIDIGAVSAELFVEDGPPSGANDAARCATAPIPVDFGDAPDDYGTTLSENGPRHGIPGYDAATNTAPLMLGPSIDIETDGFPGVDADGDDTDNIDDEDGVAGDIVLSTEDPTLVSVAVTNDTGEDATLAGWIDLNGDGDFDDPGELQTATVTASADYTLDFPEATTTDVTYARFRLFPGVVADPEPAGAASAGEVEDYLVDVRAFDVAKTASPVSGTSVTPGDTVTYTLTLSNLGTVDLIGEEVDDDLGDVLDDADLISGPMVLPADAGTASVSGDVMSFVGDIPAGEQVTVSYMVEVLDPSEGGGDGVLANAVTGGDCPEPAVTDPGDPDFDSECVTIHEVRDLSITKTSDPVDGTTVAPGDTVTYTLEIENTGGYAYSAADPAEASDDLSGVVDDAAYNGDADDGGHPGTIDYTAPDLTWTGPLAVGETVTVTYTVTVLDGESLGDAVLENVVTGTDSNCPDPAITDPADPDYDPDCHNVVDVGAVHYEKTVDPPDPLALQPGDTYTYTVTASNIGAVDLTGLTFTDDLSDVLDDATFVDGSVTVNQGTAAFNGIDAVDWSGDLDVGEVATVTYQVTIDDPPGGDSILVNGVTGTGPGSNCPPPGPATDADCFKQIPQPLIDTVKTSDAPNDPVVPGDIVQYEFTVSNDGTGPARVFEVIDDVTDVLDDAVYNGDVTLVSGPGGVSFDPVNQEIVWTGPLEVGEAATVTYSVTVNDATDLGDGVLLNVVTSPDCFDPPVTDPDDPAFNSDCVTIDPVEAWTADKTSDSVGTVEPGDVVTYTVEVENTGGVALAAVDVVNVDDLSEVLDDSSYNGDADDGGHSGTFVFAASELTWSGDLAVDEVVTLTYSVTVNDATDLGDGRLLNAVTGSTNCPDPAVTDPQHPDFDPDCVNIENVAAWTAEKTSDASDPVLPGDTITYEITVENTGNVALAAADVVNDDDLSDVLDDATYNGDAADGGHPGSFTFADTTLSWSGDLAVDEMVTLTYSVTVNDATDLGDGRLLNAVTGSSNCPDPAVTDPTDPGFDPDCVNIEDVEAWTAQKTSDAAGSIAPGDVVTYTVEVENTGNVALTTADVVNMDDLTEVLDDASYNGDADDGGHSGTFTFAASTLTWSGDLAVDEVVPLTYSVTVNDATDLGDGRLLNAVTGSSNCPDPAVTDPQDPDFDPDCVNIEDILAWTAEKTSDAAGNVEPGDVVTYTVELENTGNVALTAADVVNDDDLSSVLDDASYNGDAADGGHPGSFIFAAPFLSWSGGLAVDEVVTLTYSVTVNDADDLGDGRLLNAVTGSSNCPDPAITDPQDPDFDPDCVTIENVEAWTSEKTSDASDPVQPGETIIYEITVENTGNVDLAGADVVVEDDLSGVLDDASYNGDVDQGATYAEPVISWSDDLAVDEVVVITYTVTVNAADDLGDGRLVNAVTGGDCPDPAVTDPQDPGFDPGCVNVEDVAAYTVEKVSQAPNDPVLPGDAVSYTVIVENTGNVDLTGPDAATFSDDLSGVLDDATFNGDGSADVGIVSFSDPVISWSGDLLVGDVATVTYSVTVDEPIGGDHLLVNAVVGGDCPDPAVTDPDAPGFDPGCVIVDPLPGVDITKVVFGDRVDDLQPGDSFEYVVTVENIGEVVLVDETFSDDLSEVLDDATLDVGSITADTGTASFSDPEITWIGDLLVGEIATVRYSITIDDPVAGDGELVNGVVGSVYSNCVPPDPDDADCWEETPVPNVDVSKVLVGPENPQPGEVVTYRVTAVNRGGATAVGESVTDDLSGVLDDAVFNGDASASLDGDLSYGEPELSWVGDIAAGETLTVTYSVTVKAAGELGDGVLENAVTGGENCPDAEACSTETPLPDYEADKTLVSPAEPEPGDVVTYEVTVTNTGGAPLTEAEVGDDLSGVLDDASFNGDASATSGIVTYDQPTLTWVGPLGVDESVTIEYSVTVHDTGGLGDGELINLLASPNCSVLTTQDHHEAMPEGCVTETPIGAVEYAKSIISPDTDQVRPGEVLTYRVEIFNRGGTDEEDVSFTDDLTDVLANASYLNDAAATSGTVTYDQSTLTWIGDLPHGGSATVEYSVRVDRDIPGSVTLNNRVVGDGSATNCPTASPDVACVSDITVDSDNPLPHTGAHLARLAAIAAALMAIGWMLIATTRRRWYE